MRSKVTQHFLECLCSFSPFPRTTKRASSHWKSSLRWWPISLIQNYQFKFESEFDIKFELEFEIEFSFYVSLKLNPASNFMFKVNNINTIRRCEICSKLTIKIPERHLWYLYSQLWTYFTPCSSVSIVNFEQVNAETGKLNSKLQLEHDFHETRNELKPRFHFGVEFHFGVR